MKRARLDQSEVRCKNSLGGDMFNPSSQVAQGRMQFLDDRRAFLMIFPGCQQIDLVAVESVPGRIAFLAPG